MICHMHGDFLMTKTESMMSRKLQMQILNDFKGDLLFCSGIYTYFFLFNSF